MDDHPQILNAAEFADRLSNQVVDAIVVIEDAARRALILTLVSPDDGRKTTLSVLAGFSEHEEPELVFFAGRVTTWGDVDAL